MTDQPNNPDEQTADETFTWTGSDAPHGESADAGHDSASGAAGASGSAGAQAGTTATAILEQIRDAVDDLADRASPTVRELSARAAEFTADAADKAAPYVRRAGDVTADASSKLASKSRTWAADIRAAMASQDADASTGGPSTPAGDATAPTPPMTPTAGDDGGASDGPTPA